MSDYYISQISHSDKTAIQGVTALLQAEEIRLDTNLDYTCGMYDDEMNIIATGSCFGNTLRCLAVGSDHQGEGLMNQIISHLIEVQFNRGNTHLFLYTKCSSAKFFGDLGFYEIARIDGQIVFMENRRTGFKNYLKKLKDSSALQLQTLTESTSATNRKVAALVMNANPFTLGHQYLVEKAARENDLLHLFGTEIVPYSPEITFHRIELRILSFYLFQLLAQMAGSLLLVLIEILVLIPLILNLPVLPMEGKEYIHQLLDQRHGILFPVTLGGLKRA